MNRRLSLRVCPEEGTRALPLLVARTSTRHIRVPVPFSGQTRTVLQTFPFLGIGLCALCLAGCGTTRWSDTTRTGTEQLLISDAIDRAVSRIDLSLLHGQSVYLDPQYVDGTVDDAYLVSSLRQRLLSSGACLKASPGDADYIVEVRSGGIGTDRNDRLILGVPQMVVPFSVFGVSTAVPEIALIKTSRQVGVAKVGVFAFERRTGRPIWMSGLVQNHSALERNWILGTGPYERGAAALPAGGDAWHSGPLWQETVFGSPRDFVPPSPRDVPLDEDVLFDERDEAVAPGATVLPPLPERSQPPAGELE